MKIKSPILAAILLAGIVCSSATTVGTTGNVKIGWDPNPVSDQVTGYKLYSAPAETGPFLPLLSVGGSVTNAVHTNAPVGIIWYYLTATNFWGLESDPSEKVHTPAGPTSVTNVTIVRIPTGVQVNWAANPTNQEIKSYLVYASTNVADISSFAVIGTPTNTFHQEVMAPGFRAFFVTASNYWGEGFRSEIKTVPALPAAPARLQLVQPAQ